LSGIRHRGQARITATTTSPFKGQASRIAGPRHVPAVLWRRLPTQRRLPECSDRRAGAMDQCHPRVVLSGGASTAKRPGQSHLHQTWPIGWHCSRCAVHRLSLWQFMRLRMERHAGAVSWVPSAHGRGERWESARQERPEQPVSHREVLQLSGDAHTVSRVGPGGQGCQMLEKA
jgi:hypothetical protein